MSKVRASKLSAALELARILQGERDQALQQCDELRTALKSCQMARDAAELSRVSAQNGLTPYVYAIQALNAWLEREPVLLAELSPVLAELGLLGVKVGYDPEKGPAYSIIAGTNPMFSRTLS